MEATAMRILYISQYYPPEMGAPSARVSEFARAWAAEGHDVTVLTAFPHHPHGVKRAEDRGVLTRKEMDGDVTVVRTYVFATRNEGFLKRITSYLSFMFSAVLIGSWRVGRPDVVVATSPQLFTAVAGRLISWIKRRPMIFEVRDLWPESIVTVGAMRESLAVRMLKKLASSLYRSAERIVAVGPGYKRRIVADYPVSAEKIDVVTNGVDLDKFRFRVSDRQRVRREFGWQDSHVAMYLGTHGMAHGLEFVLEAAERLRSNPSMKFVFVGDGAEKPRLEKLAADRGLSNVEFLPPQPKENVVALYAASDVCLAPLRKVDLFTEVLPSKIFEIMGMRRPIILSVDGDARAVVEEAQAGLFVEPENVDALCDALLKVAADAAAREQMGARGRRFVERFYSRTALATQYLSVLAMVAGTAAPVPAVQPAPARAA
jgi:colanic acid biosynthesis glycosyl transferase WcaI